MPTKVHACAAILVKQSRMTNCSYRCFLFFSHCQGIAQKIASQGTSVLPQAKQPALWSDHFMLGGVRRRLGLPCLKLGLR